MDNLSLNTKKTARHISKKTTLVDLLSVPTYTSASTKSAKIVMKIPREISGVIHKVELIPLFTIATDVVATDCDNMLADLQWQFGAVKAGEQPADAFKVENLQIRDADTDTQAHLAGMTGVGSTFNSHASLAVGTHYITQDITGPLRGAWLCPSALDCEDSVKFSIDTNTNWLTATGTSTLTSLQMRIWYEDNNQSAMFRNLYRRGFSHISVKHNHFRQRVFLEQPNWQRSGLSAPVSVHLWCVYFGRCIR